MAERVDCLYRVSTTKQVDHDELNQADIPVQRKACRDFADKMGWVIVNEEQETGVSGYKVSANDRDKLQLIKKRAEQGKFDILLVFMFDRLGRKSDETPFVVEWFVKHGIRVWSVNEGEQRFESHTDRLTNYIRYWQADGESQKTSIRTKTAMGQMVQEGRFRGGGVPYGYRLAPSGILNKRKHEVCKLEIDEDEARVVRMMFNLCVGSGYGRCKIANMISGQGIKTRSGTNWHEATVGHILHNIAYTGVLRSGESQSEIFEELQIVDPDTFALAQKLMAERVNEFNAQRTMPKNISGQALLSGNIFCGHCGGRLTLTTNGTVRHNLKGGTVFRRRVRYVCYNEDGVLPQDSTYLTLKDIDLTKYKQQAHVGGIYKDYNQEQITKIQVSKQADVMVLFLLLEELFPHQVKLASWDYYEPRCLHDSSLSLSTHSVLASDIGDPELGYEMFRKACLIDLDNANPHSSDAGIHAASYGGLWQCVVQGFGGLRMLGGKLRISPNLPKAWKKLSYPLLWKGQKLAVTVTPGMVEIVNQTGSGPISLEVWGKEYGFEKELILHNKA